MNYLARRLYLLLCLSVLAGCQAAEAPAHAADDAKQIPAPVAAAPAKANTATAPTPVVANPKVTAAAIAEFKPPFPERNELFEAPKRAQSTLRREDEHGQSVELKGFINVGQPRVVLSIGGVIAAIPEGGEKYGVQVISIQPPTVVLQRGRNRWPATLE